MHDQERRRYPRIQADVLCRPTGHRPSGDGKTRDISLGGARIYTDEVTTPGTPLELELALPGGGVVVCRSVVAWVEELPAAAPARYDVGLRFTELLDSDRERLAAVLAGDD